MSPVQLLYVTCETVDQARTIGRKLIEEKLAACVNIFPQMESLYSWQDKIESANEVVLIVKTRDALAQRCINRIKELHTYTVPCILVLGVQGGNPEYLGWLLDQALPD